MNASRTVSLLSVIVTLLSYAAIAQEFTRAEIGAETSILFQNRIFSLTDVGMGERFTYNFTPSVAIESEVNGYFTNTTPKSLQDGGRAFVGLIGPKAGIRRDRFGVFFKARAGVMSFSNVLTSAAVFGSRDTARKTHAALDLGVATEFYPSARTILRFDIGRLLVRYGDSTEFRSPDGGFIVTAAGRIVAPWHLEVGTAYRLGSLHDGRERSPASQRFAAGVQYSLFSSNRGFQKFVRDESGGGGWLTWNFSKYVGLDASSTFFPRVIHLADFQQGGRMFQLLAGVRAGVRRGRLGVFGKFRPGIQRYSATEPDAVTFTNAPFTDIALDAGGIIEYYAAHHSVFRFDAGNTSIHYRSRNIVVPGGTLHAPAFANNAIQLSIGFGFRF
ncbi:MAG: hypothetical protein LAO76_25825 [Acidobacteriia bacterium]|nr:hypothetical protein [Terriglobia bacterium]